MPTTKDAFHKRILRFENEHKRFNRQYNAIATIRVLTFLSFLVLFVFFANARMGLEMGICLVLFPLLFGIVVKKHRKISYRKKHAHFLKKINERELDILQHDFSALDTGADFLHQDHPYAGDLDIFGRSSLFQCLNRTTTVGGRGMLANWLLSPADKMEITKRQEAIAELSLQLDWRQNFQARGMHFENQKVRPDKVIEWLESKKPVQGYFKAAAFVLPIVIICSIIFNILSDWPAVMTILLAVISGVILNRFQAQMKELTEEVFKHVNILGAYASLLQTMETADFHSEKLKDLKSAVFYKGKTASEGINQLYKVLDFLNARSNFFYSLIDIVFLFDLHIIMYAERWKNNHEGNLSHWFTAVSTMEALNSLSAFKFGNTDFTNPAIEEEPFQIKAEAMGHPLINADERVCNTYTMNGQGSISIVTGSNMSGKSTFLRTLGVNVVLALAGAPVCAQSFSISKFLVFTSMRTQDNLEEHVSSFYAELKRIKILLDLVSGDMPILFMLDEILKGTNSQDRHIGAVSLAKQLSDTNAFGLISTHDLALGQLAKEMNNLRNFSFNSDVVGDEIIFPYQLEAGICRSFNASKLMEKIGIKITT